MINVFYMNEIKCLHPLLPWLKCRIMNPKFNIFTKLILAEVRDPTFCLIMRKTYEKNGITDRNKSLISTQFKPFALQERRLLKLHAHCI